MEVVCNDLSAGRPVYDEDRIPIYVRYALLNQKYGLQPPVSIYDMPFGESLLYQKALDILGELPEDPKEQENPLV